MNEDRKMTVHFNNGTKLEYTFPTQIRNSSAAVLEGIKKMMESDQLVIEGDGRVTMIPWASIARLEVSPVPPALPFGVIKNAKLVQ